MTYYIHQIESLAQPLSYESIQSCRLARRAREHDDVTFFQVFLYLSEHAAQVALHVLASFELVTLLLRCRPLVRHAEMVFVARAVNHAALFQDVVRKSNEGCAAAACLHLAHILVTRAVNVRTGKVQARVVMVVKRADLFAASAVHALRLIHFGIEEAHAVGTHLYGILRADAGARRTAAALFLVCYLYHLFNMNLFLVFCTCRTTNARSRLLQPTK